MGGFHPKESFPRAPGPVWMRKEETPPRAVSNDQRKMAMSISPEEVQKVALLARLLLSPEEVDRMTSQLGQILDYMALLREVDTDGVQPMAHAVEMANVFREDQAEPSLPRELALANAPHRDEECYRVPAVLGEV